MIIGEKEYIKKVYDGEILAPDIKLYASGIFSKMSLDKNWRKDDNFCDIIEHFIIHDVLCDLEQGIINLIYQVSHMAQYLVYNNLKYANKFYYYFCDDDLSILYGNILGLSSENNSYFENDKKYYELLTYTITSEEIIEMGISDAFSQDEETITKFKNEYLEYKNWTIDNIINFDYIKEFLDKNFSEEDRKYVE